MISYSALTKILRPRQWIKNLFVILPVLLLPAEMRAENFLGVLVGFLCFCTFASSIYILNDFLDRQHDQYHPRKKLRPLASGEVSVTSVFILGAGILICGLIGAYSISIKFLLWGVTYLVLMSVYSLGLKHRPPMDVLIIALGFVIRVEAGSSLLDVTPTTWLLTITFLLSLFLALAKRRDDIVQGLDTSHRPSLKGYNRLYLDISITVVLSAFLVCYILYTIDPVVIKFSGSDKLYLTVPIVILGVLRYLQILFVFNQPSDPENVLANDKMISCAIISWMIILGLILYY